MTLDQTIDRQSPHGEAQLTVPLCPRGDRLPAELAALRRERPVARVRTMTGDEAWLVSSHALATQVLEDDRFSLPATATPGAPRQYALTIPPEIVNNMGNINSAGLRDAVMRSLSPKAGRDVVGWLRGQADALIDALVAEGPPVDLRTGFSEPYSAALHCRIIGIPVDDWRELMSGLDIAFIQSPVPHEGFTANWNKAHAYLVERVRAAAPGDPGLLGRLAAVRAGAEPGEGLTDENLATVAVSLFGAGAVSTSAFLLHAVLTLLREPGLADRLRKQPEQIGGAVEELLRVNLSIGDGLPRLATADVVLGDILVREGELVLVCVEGANFDPEVFADADRVDPEREHNPHLSFGAGRHYCPATALGRVHAEVALTALLGRLPELRLAVPQERLVWRTGFIKRLPERLPVLW